MLGAILGAMLGTILGATLGGCRGASRSVEVMKEPERPERLAELGAESEQERVAEHWRRQSTAQVQGEST